MKAVRRIIIAVCIGLIISFAAFGTCEAQATQNNNYPIIGEVVEHDGKFIVEIDSAQKVTVRHGGKPVHCDKVGKRVWLCKLAKGKRYVISSGKYRVEYKIL